MIRVNRNTTIGEAIEILNRDNKGISKRLLLKFFRLNPDILDPAWEDRNPGHAERDYARILRWEFCRNLRVGAVEYRSRPRTTRKKKSSRASWPTTRAEREALKIVGRHHDINRGHMLPMIEPFAKYYRRLIPSALNAFARGDRRAILSLAVEAPGLLLFRGDEDWQEDTRETKLYYKKIKEFQSAFREILGAGELRSGRLRSRLPSDTYAERYFALYRMIRDAGVKMPEIYRFLRETSANPKDPVSEGRKKHYHSLEKGFADVGDVTGDLRRRGGQVFRLPLVMEIGQWILVHFFTRKDNELPDVSELAKTAKKTWTRLENNCPSDINVKTMARNIMQLFGAVLNKIPREIFHDDFAYNVFIEGTFDDTLLIYGKQRSGTDKSVNEGDYDEQRKKAALAHVDLIAASFK